LLVEHLARITQTAYLDSRLFEILSLAGQALGGQTGLVILTACKSTRQIEHVEFNPRMTEQMGDIGEPLGVFEPKGAIAVTNRPILTLFAENPIY
jgi:hypothetical protein